jgi:cell division transport system permease protein
MRFQYVLSEIRSGLRRNVTMTIAVVITVAISIAMLGTGLLVREQTELTQGFWNDKVEVSVYMCNEHDGGEGCEDGAVTEAQRDSIRQTLDDHPEVAKVYFENQEEAYENFQSQFDESFASMVSPSSLQDSFRVALKDPERTDSVASAVKGLPGVVNVQDERELFGGLFKVLNGFMLGAVVIALLQVVAATLLIANTIRLAAYNRRRETGIMRLVGASNFYIQLPFILEAAIAGLLGSLLGVVAVFGVEELLVERLIAPNIRSTAWVGFGDVLNLVPWLLITGVAISAIASFFTLRRYLRV